MNQNIKLKVAFYGAKEYDKIYFCESCDPDIEIRFLATKLTEETAHLAQGYDAVCAFVNDTINSQVCKIFNRHGVSLVLLRCAGYNNVDMRAAQYFGITVLRVPNYSPYAVAEHAMAIIQMANRRLHKAYYRVKDNNFALTGLLGVDLHGKTAGIMGTGKIGCAMASICQGYGMNVIAWDPNPKRELERQDLLTYVSKEKLFQDSDLISLHIPLVDGGKNSTYHIIDGSAIDLMKDSVMLVNTSRGALIDTEALIEALKQRKFHAVALDVYEGEDSNVYVDYSDEPICSDITARLLSFPNVVVTSHQAFFTREALKAIADVTIYNARNYKLGRDFGNALVEY